MDSSSAAELISYLKMQKKHTGSDLPSRHHILVEHFSDPRGRAESKQVILHTLWGGKVNAPYATAFRQAWEDACGHPLQVFHDDNCIMFNLPHEFQAGTVLDLVTSSNLTGLLRKKLESTGFFGARFRENASRALLLPKVSFNRRMPFWLNRLRSKKLLQAVMKYDDFPVLTETWKTCLNLEFDLDSLSLVLEELARREFRISEVFTSSPSPFASGLVWQQTETYMYEDDTPPTGEPSNLRGDILKEVLFSSELRPRIPRRIIEEYTKKLQRVFPGYTPVTPRDLLDWVKERILIPLPEWEDLKTALDRDTGGEGPAIIREIQEKIDIVTPGGNGIECITAKESISRITKVLHPGDEDGYRRLLAEWLRYYGPVTPGVIHTVFAGEPSVTEKALQLLLEEQIIIMDRITEGTDVLEICDSQNLEFLLRLKRKKQRPEFDPLPLQMLPLFVAHVQGLTLRGSSLDSMKRVMEQLLGYPAPASLWEKEILPSRITPYFTSWMDSLFLESDLVWCGTGKEAIQFSFFMDLDTHVPIREEKREILRLLPDPRGRYTFWDLKEHLNMSTEEVTSLLWKETWKGHLSNDSFDALRKGMRNSFKAETVTALPPGRRRSRSGFSRWKSSHPVSGNWFLLPALKKQYDLLEKEELKKERVRQVLSRYGLVCREIVSRETKPFSWKELFPALRRMELSGELVSGCFFSGIPGLQFTSMEYVRMLQDDLPRDTVYWMNARDPASLCGMGFENSGAKLPSRIRSNHMVYHGEELVLVSRKNRRIIEFRVPPGSEHLDRYLEFFNAPILRDFDPEKNIRIEEINSTPAAESPYADPLLRFGFARNYKSLILRKRFQV